MSNEGSTQGKRFHYGYLIVATLVMMCFIPLSLGLSCAGIFYPAISSTLNVSTGTLSYYTSFIWAAALVSLPLLGKMLARLDARICLTGAVALIAIAFVWLSFISSLWQYYVGAFAIGIGVAMLLFMAPSTLINRWFAKRAGFFLGLVMAFTGIGGFVFSTVGGILIQQIGWQATYLVFAALCVITLPLTLFVIRSDPKDKGLKPYGYEEVDTPDSPAAAIGVPAEKAFKSSLFFLIVAACFCLNLGMYVYFMIPSYASSLPLSVEMPLLGATASSVAMAGQTISKLVLGMVGDKHPHIGAIAGVSLGIVGVALFAAGGASAVAFYVAAFLYGFFYGVTNVMMPLLTRRSFGDRDYAKIYARISMAASISCMLSGFIWGALINATGGFTVLFVGSVLFMIATIVLLIFVKRDSNRADSQAAGCAADNE